jgi:hypothetical protein
MTFRVPENTEASRLFEQLLAPEEGFCCTESVNSETEVLSFVALSNISCSLVTENPVFLL